MHSSNFDSEVTDFLTDLVVAGWAVLYADTNRDKGGFTFNTWSIGNCYISSTQANGLIDTIYREFELSAEQIVSEFGIDNVSDKVKTALEKKPDQKFTLVQAIFPRDSKLVKGEEGKRVSTSMPFASYTIEAQSKHILKESGFEEFPCVVSRFKKIPDSHYGLGMGSMVISDAKTANQLTKLSLQTAELNLGGLWVAQHDGVVNPNTLRIRPNAIIAANSVDAIKRLDTGSASVGLGLDFLQHFQAKIKRTLMSDQLTPQGSSPLTATEIQARVQVYRNQLGSIFSRMQSEYLQVLLERCWGLSMRSGVLPPAPEELMQASRISFNFINPMAASQKLEWVTAIQNLMLNVSQMAQIDQTVMDNLNLDAMVQVMADALSVPVEAIRTDEEIAELRQAKQEQQQAMQEQQQQQEQALQLIQAQNRTIDELENYNNKLVKHCNQLNEKENELINIIKKLQNPKLSEDLLQNLESSLKQRLQSHLEQLVTGLNLKNEINKLLPTMIYTELEKQISLIKQETLKELGLIKQETQQELGVLKKLTLELSSRL